MERGVAPKGRICHKLPFTVETRRLGGKTPASQGLPFCLAHCRHWRNGCCMNKQIYIHVLLHCHPTQEAERRKRNNKRSLGETCQWVHTGVETKSTPRAIRPVFLGQWDLCLVWSPADLPPPQDKPQPNSAPKSKQLRRCRREKPEVSQVPLPQHHPGKGSDVT